MFGDRYKALVIELPDHGGEKDYLRSVIWYVHLNPVRAGLVRRTEKGCWDWEGYDWSSLVSGYFRPKKQRKSWMKVAMSFDMERCTDSRSGRHRYRRLADARADEWKAESSSGREPEERRPSTGWYSVGEDFRDWLLDGIEERLVGKSDSYSSSEQAHEHGEQRAQELLEAGCRFFDWTSTDLEALKGGDVRRLLIAELIRGKTSVNQQWIAENLKLKSAGNVSQQLRRLRQDLRDTLDAKLRKKWERFVKNVGLTP